MVVPGQRLQMWFLCGRSCVYEWLFSATFSTRAVSVARPRTSATLGFGLGLDSGLTPPGTYYDQCHATAQTTVTLRLCRCLCLYISYTPDQRQCVAHQCSVTPGVPAAHIMPRLCGYRAHTHKQGLLQIGCQEQSAAFCFAQIDKIR